jgi:hypothetical protein
MRIGKSTLTLTVGLFAMSATYAQGLPGPMFGSQNARQKLIDFPATVQLFPNPANEVVNIIFEIPCARRVKIVLYSIIGNSIDVWTERASDLELQITIKELPPGYYLLSIYDPETNFKSTLKFLKI